MEKIDCNFFIQSILKINPSENPLFPSFYGTFFLIKKYPKNQDSKMLLPHTAGRWPAFESSPRAQIMNEGAQLYLFLNSLPLTPNTKNRLSSRATSFTPPITIDYNFDDRSLFWAQRYPIVDSNNDPIGVIYR
ncbi:hypothetical protein AO498_13562 [Algoriphagus sanaruensis]|uniref:Uncharacterized protein n=1 Tax=Algoriphagus sanaruensis TaxID=1727163 RepID=A0A142EQR5_9BACT|nr:hypothetical protein AO498_13562 [Algoriphagus sanaruensis]